MICLCWQEQGDCNPSFGPSTCRRMATLHGSENWNTFECKEVIPYALHQRTCLEDQRTWWFEEGSLHVGSVCSIHVQSIVRSPTPQLSVARAQSVRATFAPKGGHHADSWQVALAVPPAARIKFTFPLVQQANETRVIYVPGTPQSITQHTDTALYAMVPLT